MLFSRLMLYFKSKLPEIPRGSDCPDFKPYNRRGRDNRTMQTSLSPRSLNSLSEF